MNDLQLAFICTVQIINRELTINIISFIKINRKVYQYNSHNSGMEQELSVIDNGSRVVITITELLSEETLTKLQTQIELGQTPTWVVDRIDINERKEVAQRGSGGSHCGLKSKDVESPPQVFQDVVNRVESNDVGLKNVEEFNVDRQDRDAHFHLSGTINGEGKFMNTPNIRLIYEGGYDIEIVKTVPTAEGGAEIGHEELELSHNEVVTQMDESTNWVSESDKRHAENFNSDMHTNFVDYLFAVYIEGHITDGWFENEIPPFDYTELLEKEHEVGRLIYYAYRYNGWKYDEQDLVSDVEELNSRYSDGGWLII